MKRSELESGNAGHLHCHAEEVGIRKQVHQGNFKPLWVFARSVIRQLILAGRDKLKENAQFRFS